MFSIRISQIKNGLDASDLLNINVDNYFCAKCLSGKHKKCKQFYMSIIDKNETMFLCPYGYVCYKPLHNCETVLTAIFCEKSNTKKIISRKKCTNLKNEKFISLEKIIPLFNSYNEYIFYVSTCNNICHDLNNALNYLMEIAEILESDEREFLKDYKDIVLLIGDIQSEAVYEQFRQTKTYSTYDLRKKTKVLFDKIENSYEAAEQMLKKIDYEQEENRYCFYAGFSLLRTLLRRNLMFVGEQYASKGKIKEFSIHKMVKKIVSLLKYKANGKNVSFPAFIGSPNCKLHNNVDNVFTAIFTVIDNAVKYSFRNENIYINFKEENGKLILSISNKANELSQDEIEKIHQKGFRGSNKTPKGHGLGLYLVDCICFDCNVGHRAEYKNGTFTYQFIFTI